MSVEELGSTVLNHSKPWSLFTVCQWPTTDTMIEAVSNIAGQVIVCAPPTNSNAVSVAPLPIFVGQLLERSKVHTATFLATLVYLDRFRKKLPPTARGMHCTCHRIFLASLLVACKYMHDTPIKNRTWAAHSMAFSLAEVNLMERQLLFLLDFDLRIGEKDFTEMIVLHIQPPTIPYTPSLSIVSSPSTETPSTQVISPTRSEISYLHVRPVTRPSRDSTASLPSLISPHPHYTHSRDSSLSSTSNLHHSRDQSFASTFSGSCTHIPREVPYVLPPAFKERSADALTSVNTVGVPHPLQ